MLKADIFLRTDVSAILQSGGVCVVPTDTVYGLVCRAADKKAVERLYRVKAREQSPGTIIAASVEQLVELGFPERALRSIEHYWPNPLSVVVSARAVQPYLKANRVDLPVRIPNDPALAGLLRLTGPLMTTSANTPKAPTAHTIDEARAYFDDKVDLYVDAGDLGDRPPSTIIGINPDHSLVVYREGAVKIQ